MAADIVNLFLRQLCNQFIALLLSPGIGIQQDGTQLPALVVQQGAAFPEGGDAQGGHGLPAFSAGARNNRPHRLPNHPALHLVGAGRPADGVGLIAGGQQLPPCGHDGAFTAAGADIQSSQRHGGPLLSAGGARLPY